MLDSRPYFLFKSLIFLNAFSGSISGKSITILELYFSDHLLLETKVASVILFANVGEVLYNGVKGVTDLIVKQGRINLDFADIQTVMLEMGKAMMGTGEAEGDERAIKAAEIAISNPLLDDTSIANAKGVIINISGGEDVKLYEIDEIAAHVKKQCKENVNLIVGNTIEKIEDGKIRVSLLASGIGAQGSLQESQDQEAESFKKPRLVELYLLSFYPPLF